MNKKIIALLIGVLSFLQWGYGQYVLPDFQVQKVKDGKALIRWEPRSTKEWSSSLMNGYSVKVYDLQGGKESLVQEALLKPADSTAFLQLMQGQKDTLWQNFYLGAKDLLYYNDALSDELKQVMVSDDGKSPADTEDILEFRMGFLLYTLTYDFKLSELAGLGYEFQVKEGHNYRVVVQTGSYAPFEYQFVTPFLYSEPIPELLGKFGDKEVALKWRTREFRKRYFGYFLEQSPNGFTYEPVNSLPYVNVFDTSSFQESPLQFIEEKLPLPINYKDFWFRIKGFDYFGHTTAANTVVMGHGYDRIKMNPIVNLADQTENNEARISWTVPHDLNRLIKAFEISRCDSIDGIYNTIVEGIPATQREIKIPMISTHNYYRVVIVPKDGDKIMSLPVFIMGMDTIPPAVPSNIKAVIDTTGVVHLSWDKNLESDFRGYKVFWSNFKEDEFSLLTNSPIPDNIYIDTIDLRTPNEKVFYKLISLDTRNNRSAFSEIIELQRPDILEPTAPALHRAKVSRDSVFLLFDCSHSDDVVRYDVYRKEIGIDEQWQLLSSFDTSACGLPFIDTKLTPLSTYAYTIIAIDDADLESIPSQPATAYIREFEYPDWITNIKQKVDVSKKSYELSWEYSDPSEISELIIYSGTSPDKMIMYQVLDNKTRTLVETDGKAGETYYFYLRPILRNGRQAKYSDLISIKME